MTRYVDVHRPMSIIRSRSLDSQLLRMICKEYHPFSLVEDNEFKEFVRMLCHSYTLPSRKTLTNSLLPASYNEVLLEVKDELQHASAVSLTSDGWTNINNMSFYALTAHFIDRCGTLKSYLLECSEFNEKHTGENIASWIAQVLKTFNIDFKITAIVTDNAANMKSAASILNIRNVSCYAHSLNLAVQNAIAKSIKLVVDKVKLIVQFFKKSTSALSKLVDMQKPLNKAQLKLKQDVPTRWNSTFDMLDRVLINKEPIVSTLALLDSTLSLDSSEWDVIEHSVNMLRTFHDVTVEISSEQSVSLSKTCVLYRIMIKKMSTFPDASLPQSVRMLKTELVTGLQKRFGSIEDNELRSQAVLLDPRFKKQAFGDDSKFQLA
ncbi:E3 SUMO-protein ligase ZBED1-like [Toxorhynchites rutilus septentrionalis]|uniref:E3 SUMO-protein ligase ZBED1-like n=1 Tax=Toxorhynchites rutilus septentrionalis TaxID=329112 RepID=UPI0024794882|nr:E3 SUMO-protein ligase ZBED1-like [Toxorhynchites rutilus septentrionalis]